MIAGIWKRFRTHEARVTERMSRLAEVETFRALMFAGIAEGKTIQISAQNRSHDGNSRNQVVSGSGGRL